jgi:hypothetical protein
MSRAFLVFATNVKAEHPYLAEWLEYHRLVGVDHFYLYDQDGGDETRSLLRPYQESGLVTREPWTHLDGTRHDGPTRFYQRNKNHLAFAHCVQRYRDRFDWAMKIDVDEFLVPLDGTLSVRGYLATFDRARVKGLRVPRINFGDNGHRVRPEGLVIESYTRREAAASDSKDLGNSAFLTENRFCGSAHRWDYRRLTRARLVRPASVTGLRVNHYYTKSLEEYRRRQNVSRGRGRTEAHFLERNRGANAVRDDGMLRFAPLVRRALAARAAAVAR